MPARPSVFALGDHRDGCGGIAAATCGAARRLRCRRGERQVAGDQSRSAVRERMRGQGVGALPGTAVAAGRAHLRRRRRRMQRQVLRIANGDRGGGRGSSRSGCSASTEDAIQIAQTHVLGEQRVEVGQLVVGRHQLLRQQRRIEVLVQSEMRRPELGGQRMAGQGVRRQRYAQRKLGQACIHRGKRQREREREG